MFWSPAQLIGEGVVFLSLLLTVFCAWFVTLLGVFTF
jgi:hypothetical protein